MGYFILIILSAIPAYTLACSTFKLQKGDGLVYGHNLNQEDLGVPGLLFINQRGIYKTGIAWRDLTAKDSSDFKRQRWISRYGSVSFNTFGKNLPDGGMNESGLVIWEMNDDTEYPQNDSLPRLCQMNWMQYILDNCSTLDEAIQCAYTFQIDGWGWHYFVGDRYGNTAAIEFHNGQVVIHSGDEMPIPALFNTSYDRELELLKFYEGYGGQYEIDILDPSTPRFVRSAKMIEDYKPSRSMVKYGLKMLENLRVNDDPEWSVLFDPQNMELYFRTRLHPKIKTLDMAKVNFSNLLPARILNIDIEAEGNISNKFESYSNARMLEFTEDLILPILPETFFTSNGITIQEYLRRLSAYSDAPTLEENQFFRGIWEFKKGSGATITLDLSTRGDAVTGELILPGGKETYYVDHLQMLGNELKFTYRSPEAGFIEVQGTIDGNQMKISLQGMEDFYGNFIFTRNASL